MHPYDGGSRRVRSALLGLLLTLPGSLATAATESEPPMTTHHEYLGTATDLPVAFRYPATWRLEETTGHIDIYRQVRLEGPRNSDDTFTASFVVRSSPLRRAGGRHDTLNDLVMSHTTHGAHGGQIIAEHPRHLAEIQAVDLTISYVIPPLHQRGLVPKEVPVMSRAVLCQHHDRLYEVLYSADARDYDQFAKDFDELLKSLRWVTP